LQVASSLIFIFDYSRHCGTLFPLLCPRHLSQSTRVSYLGAEITWPYLDLNPEPSCAMPHVHCVKPLGQAISAGVI